MICTLSFFEEVTVCSGKHIRGVNRASMFRSRAYTQVNLHPSSTHFQQNTNENNSPRYCDFAVSLSGFIYLRNKQGTEYCKITAHISNSSPLVFSFLCLLSSLHPVVCRHLSDHLESYPCMLGWVSLNSLILMTVSIVCVVNDFVCFIDA